MVSHSWVVVDVAEVVVGQAFEAGYRHIDTAKIYDNVSGVGRAIAASGVDRDDLFITSKLWNSDRGYESTLAAFEGSMERLGMETLDLYLIHWLQPKQGKYVDTRKALVELQKRGRFKSIGVADFTIEALQEIIAATGVVSAINQVETHPYFNQAALRALKPERHPAPPVMVAASQGQASSRRLSLRASPLSAMRHRPRWFWPGIWHWVRCVKDVRQSVSFFLVRQLREAAEFWS